MENETRICKECGRDLPIENFKSTRFGTRVHVCTECATRKLRETYAVKKTEKQLQDNLEQAKKNERRKLLSKFSPRDLMEELARRGYTGILQFVQVHEIDITNF